MKGFKEQKKSWNYSRLEIPAQEFQKLILRMKARVSISEIWPRHINGDDGGNARSHLLLEGDPLEDLLV